MGAKRRAAESEGEYFLDCQEGRGLIKRVRTQDLLPNQTMILY